MYIGRVLKVLVLAVSVFAAGALYRGCVVLFP